MDEENVQLDEELNLDEIIDELSEETNEEESINDDETIEVKKVDSVPMSAFLKLKAKLKDYEQKEKEDELKQKKRQIAEKYIEKGYDEDEAEEKAEKDTKVEKLESELKILKYERQAEKLESKYPAILDNLDRLIDICNKTGWTLDKVCAAEFGTNTHDDRIKSEQEQALLKKKVSKPAAATQTPLQSVKLELEDERAYQFYIKKNPGISRKQYSENVINAGNTKIPHDRWD